MPGFAESRGNAAYDLFLSGYTCAQSVVLAFEDMLVPDRGTLLSLSAPFGGGIGRLRSVCGAVSGALMVLGMVCGKKEQMSLDEKAEFYALVREYTSRFSERSGGSIICSELLADVIHTDGGRPEERTAEYYSKRPCPGLCRIAAEVLAGMLEEKGITKQSQGAPTK